MDGVVVVNGMIIILFIYLLNNKDECLIGMDRWIDGCVGLLRLVNFFYIVSELFLVRIVYIVGFI